MIAALFKRKPINRHHGTQQTASPDDRVDDRVRVSRKGLIALRQQAAALPLNAGKILAAQGGAYLSPFKGRGMEFEESRIYQAGDDIRNMDWRVTARTGTAHTKVFREERERAVLLWVDLRRPMFFATQGAFKSVQAARTAALLSWSAIQHGDRLGGLIFSEQQHDELRPQRGDGAVLHFINRLANHPAWQATPTAGGSHTTSAQSLSRLRRVARPGSLIILCSDFHDLDPQAESHLIQLARHNDVIMTFFYDPLEAQLPPGGLYHISDGRQRLLLNTADRAVCERHRQRFARHQGHLQTLARRYGLFYISIASQADLLPTLQQQLRLRQT